MKAVKNPLANLEISIKAFTANADSYNVTVEPGWEVKRPENYIHNIHDTGIYVRLPAPGKSKPPMAALLKWLHEVYVKILRGMVTSCYHCPPMLFSKSGLRQFVVWMPLDKNLDYRLTVARPYLGFLARPLHSPPRRYAYGVTPLLTKVAVGLQPLWCRRGQ